MSLSKPGDYPRWATNLLNNGPLGSQNRTEPDETKKDSGWNAGERPARNFANWLQYLNNEWISYFDQQWDTAGQISFNFSQNLATTSGLTFGIDAGTITFDGVESIIASTTLILNASSTTVIGFNLDALTIAQYTSGGEPTSDFVKLFVVTTNVSAITSVDDRRTFFQVQSRLQSGDNKLIIDGATDTLSYTNNGVSILYADPSGNVGINITGPLGKLHVRQNASGISSVSPGANGIILEDNNSAGITIATPNTQDGALLFADPESNTAGGMTYLHSGDVLTLRTNDSTNLAINSAGNVSIASPATANPSGKLHIQDGSSGVTLGSNKDLVIESNDSTVIQLMSPNTASPAIFFADPQANSAGGLEYSHGAGKMHLRVEDQNRASLDSAGQMVIANASDTVAPLAKLHVKTGSSGAAPVSSDGIFVESAGSTHITIGTSATDIGSLNFADTGSQIVGAIQYDNSTDKLHLAASGATKVTVVGSNGNVGVGEQAPFAKVHVKQGSSGVAGLNAGGDGLFIEGAGIAGLTIGTPNSVEANIFFADPQNNVVGGFQYDHANDILSLRAGGLQTLRIDGVNDVVNLNPHGANDYSISTTKSLRVNIDSDANQTGTSFTVGHDQNTTADTNVLLKVLDTGNVGVGLSLPQGKVHVFQGESGVSSALTDADALVLEDSGSTGITIQTPNTASGNIRFVDPESNNAGSFSFDHATDILSAQIEGVAKLSISSATTTVTNDLTVTGNLTVNGTTTTINSTTVTVDDKNLEIGSVAVPTDITADGGGITLKGTTDKTINWTAATGDFDVSENWDLASGKSYKINNVSVLNGTTLGSGVVNSSLTSVGIITSGVWNGTAIANANLANSSLTINGTNISLGGSGTVTAAAGTLTGSTLATGVTASSLTSVGTLSSLVVSGTEHVGGSAFIGATSGTALGKLHVKQGTSGVSSVYSSADDIVIEGSTASGLSILTPNNSYGYLAFTDPDAVNPGLIEYDHTNNKMNLQTNSTSKVSVSNTGKTVITTGSSETVSALGQLHVKQAASGVSAIGANADGIVIEGADNTGLTICTTNIQSGILAFADPESDLAGYIEYNHGTDKLGFSTATTTKMVIDSLGNVGINNLNPSTKLHVTGTTTLAGTVIVSGAGIQLDNGQSIATKNSGGALRSALVMSGANNLELGGTVDGGIKFFTSLGNERMFIDSAGNVGIGETAPIAKLHVKEGESGATPFANTDTLFIEHSSHAGLTIGTPNTSEGSIFFADPESSTQGGISYSHPNNYLAFRAGNIEGARLEGDGDFFLNTGKLGVGISPSSGKIHSQATGADNVTYIETVTSGNPVLSLSATGSGGYQLYNDRATNSFRIKTEGGADRVTVSSAGDVGVGTPTPLGKVHIKTGASNLTTAHDSGDDFIIEGSGHTGMTISTTSAFNGHLYFSDLANQAAEVGLIRYQHGIDTMDFWTAGISACSINSTQQLLVKNGTAGSPGLSFVGEIITDTGVFSPGDGILGFSCDGVERARLSSGGNVTFRVTSSEEFFNSFNITNNNVSTTASLISTLADRISSNPFHHIKCTSGASNLVFTVKGDGQITSDIGGISTPGADYAEMFEWSDSNINNEDRVGYAVSLVSAKIKIASAGEMPVGVISGAPTIIGDGHELSWSSKWLTDDFGRRILDEDGNQQYSPDYDPTTEYIPRSKRKEWSPVGLMGKLVLRKGQITASNWIKLKDINENLELWLVR